MNYSETLEFLYGNLPMYQRVGAVAFKKDLTNIIKLCETLGNPQAHYPTIHVAGTNGKGSVSHFLSAILQSAGYKTGLYTSPHLVDFRERIRIDGQLVSEDFVIDFTERIAPQIAEFQPSFFEITVAMAFEAFRAARVDVAVIETGLGGRLDSTNIINPILSVITNISEDHMDMLGNTIEEIAGEKAGIIKAGIPVVIGEHNINADPVFRQVAEQKSSKLVFAEDHRRNFQIVQSSWPDYRLKNVNTALAAIEELAGFDRINTDAIQEGIVHVSEITGLRGRWEQLSDLPRLFCDTGHNKAGIQEVVRCIKRESYEHLHLVLGLAEGKDPDAILGQFPTEARFYFCRPDVPRGMPVSVLAGWAEKNDLRFSVHDSVALAYHTALENAQTNDLIFVGGSTFVVADLLMAL